MSFYMQLGRSELVKILDVKGRNKSVAANLFPIVTLVGNVVYWLVATKLSVWFVLLGLVLLLVSFCVGVHIQASALIESVYRCKEGKNQKIYLKNRVYFDKKFMKMRVNREALHKTRYK